MGTCGHGKAVCVFENVQPGVYATSAFHDENDNQNLDTGLFGIPKLSSGASGMRTASVSSGSPETGSSRGW